jgi:hypothetical protein
MGVLAAHEHLGSTRGVDTPELPASRARPGGRACRCGALAARRLELASGSGLEFVGGDGELPVVIVDRGDLVARKVVHDLCSVVRPDP